MEDVAAVMLPQNSLKTEFDLVMKNKVLIDFDHDLSSSSLARNEARSDGRGLVSLIWRPEGLVNSRDAACRKCLGSLDGRCLGP